MSRYLISLQLDQIYYSILFYGLFTFLGFGLTVIFCPNKWRKYTFFLSPIIGYCFFTLASWYFFTLDFRGTDSYYPWIILSAFILLVAALLKIWKQKIILTLLSKDLIILVLIAVIILLAISFPSLSQKEMTSLSIGNNDIASYAFYSKASKSFSKNELHGLDPWSPDINKSGWGSYAAPALFCSVVKLDTYQVQMVSLYVFFILSLFLTYIVAKEVFTYSTFASYIVTLLYGLNSLMYYVIYHGFLRQIISTSLILCAVLFNVAIIRTSKFADAVRYVPYLVFIILGLILTSYIHILVIIYALIIVFVLILFWESKNRVMMLNFIKVNCIAFLVCWCFFHQAFRRIMESTFYLRNDAGGWFIPWITPQQLFGFSSLIEPLDKTNFEISVFLAIIIPAGLIKLYRRHKENFLLSIVTVLLITIGAVILSILGKTDAGLGGYKQFKLVSSFLPLILVSSLALLSDVSFNMRNIGQEKLFCFLAILVLVSFNGLSSVKTLYKINQDSFVPPPDSIGLQVIRDDIKIKSVNIPADSIYSYWNIMWEAYFLFPKKLFFEQSTYYPATSPNGEWWLIRNNNTEKILSVLSKRNTIIMQKSNRNIIQINSTYMLSKDRFPPGLNVKFGKNWSNSEIIRRWSISDEATIIINSDLENRCFNLTLKYWPLKKENSLSVYLNNLKIKDCENNNTCSIDNVLLKKGENTLGLKAKLPAEKPGTSDSRELCYCFETIKIKEVDCR